MSGKTEVIPIRLGVVNVFALRGSRTVLVDTGYMGSEAMILGALDRYGIHPQDVSLIVITHGHTDHFGSAEALRQKTGAGVAVAPEDAPALREGFNPPLCPVNLAGRVMKFFADHVRQPALPVPEPHILIRGAMDLSSYGVAARILHTPGHTSGSCSVLAEGGEVMVGDLFCGGFLVSGRPQYSFFCQDCGQRDDSIQKVLDLKPSIIYAGHGGPFTAEAVRRAFRM